MLNDTSYKDERALRFKDTYSLHITPYLHAHTNDHFIIRRPAATSKTCLVLLHMFISISSSDNVLFRPIMVIISIDYQEEHFISSELGKRAHFQLRVRIVIIIIPDPAH